MKKLLSFLALIVSVLAVFAIAYTNNVDAANGTTVTKTSFADGEQTTASLDSVVSYTTAQGGGTSAPAWNAGSGSGEIRLYQNSSGTGGGTITIKVVDGYHLTNVTIGSNMTTKVAYTLESNTNKSTTVDLAQGGKYSVDELTTSITFYCMGTSKTSRLYVNYISATYEEGDVNVEVETPDEALFRLVNDYRNDGVYTKKSEIFLKTESEVEVNKLFHGNVANQERTTYYNGETLLMGDFTGGFDKINSGYRTNDKGTLNHFRVDASKIDVASQDKNITNTSIYTKDSYAAGKSLHDFYVTLDKLSEQGYFEGWELKDGKYIHSVSLADRASDEYLLDFLAFAAPCLENIALTNYILVDKLEVSEESTSIQNSSNKACLVFRLYVSSGNSGVVTDENSLLLSEARVYKGNESFDENYYYDINLAINDKDLGSVVYDGELTHLLKGTKVEFTLDYDTDLVFAEVYVGDSKYTVTNNKFAVTVNGKRDVKVNFYDKLADDHEKLIISTNEVTTELELPNTTTHGSTVVWSVKSGNATITNNFANFTQTNVEQTVVLTATLTLGSKNMTKDFEITVLASGAVAKQEYTQSITFNSQGLSSGAVLDSFTIGDVKLQFSKGSGSSDPAYYTTGSAARLYANNTLTFTALNGAKIKSITLTFNGSSYTPTSSNYSITAGSYSNGVITFSSYVDTCTFSRGSGSGHFRITSIKVVYEK